MSREKLLNMLKIMRFPFAQIIVGLSILTTITNFAKISSSQNSKNPIGEESSVPMISSRRLRAKFMEEQLKIILQDPNHPLNFLVDYSKQNWKSRKPYPENDIDDQMVDDILSRIDEMELDEEEKKRRKQEILDNLDPIGVQAGHTYTRACLDSGKPETLALEDALGNQADGWGTENPRVKGCMKKEAIEIEGVIIHRHFALNMAKAGMISEEIVKNAPRHDGYSALTGSKSKSSKQSELSLEPFATPKRNGNTETSGAFSDMLSGKINPAPSNEAAKSAPGGIDFSTLELRYISEDSSLFKDGSIKYSFDAKPSASNKNISDKSIAAVQASDAFFVWLSLSPKKFWVNLRSDEPNRVIDPQLAKTDAGRILLQSDLQMKKTVAKLTQPDTSTGKQYWKQLVYYQQSNSSLMCLPVSRNWIVPAPATVREDGNGMYIADAPLDVKLEVMKDAKSKLLASSTYKARGFGSCTPASEKLETLYESLARRLILPQIVRAVNTAPEYAELRRVYRSRVAAEWYRQRSTSKATAYANLIDSENVSSWPARQNWSSRQVFNQYVKSFTKGEYQVTRKWRQGNMMLYGQVGYGGVDFSRILFKQLNAKDFQKKWGNLEQVADDSMKSPVADPDGKIWLGGNTTTGKATITGRSAWKMIWFSLTLGFLMLPLFIRWRRSQKKNYNSV